MRLYNNIGYNVRCLFLRFFKFICRTQRYTHSQIKLCLYRSRKSYARSFLHQTRPVIQRDTRNIINIRYVINFMRVIQEISTAINGIYNFRFPIACQFQCNKFYWGRNIRLNKRSLSVDRWSSKEFLFTRADNTQSYIKCGRVLIYTKFRYL